VENLPRENDGQNSNEWKMLDCKMATTSEYRGDSIVNKNNNITLLNSEIFFELNNHILSQNDHVQTTM